MKQRSVSPSKFESQATNSPSKLSVPNRKQRNQPSNRVHDIEFATEISTSLLSQVRNLQALLAEKEEALKTVTYEKSRLEAEAEGFHQHLRTLDESEHRYKDENWNLETQIHEYLAAAKEATDREKKLTQSLHIAQAEKSSAQKELDEIKLSHAKLVDEHAATVKHHDVELGSVKRSITMAENERGALQRKIEDLTGQNQELAKAVAHQRGRLEDRDQARGLSDEDFETAPDNVTPEHSPPPSPIKGTPRHSMLESETLKSSLQHAHRMIQQLKGNIHREKTEKLELKRMLQDARDELETRRGEGMGSGTKKNRKVDSKEFKKPLKPGQLGGLRSSRSEIFVDDTNWEEDNGERSPSRSAAVTAAHDAAGAALVGASTTDTSDHFESAHETNDDFDTANERATETEDFQTGVEDMSGSDDLTETEGGPSGTLRKKPSPLSLSQPGNRQSFQSTASTSGDEYSYEDSKTPITQPQPQRLRLKVSRGGNRRSRQPSEEPQFQSSPASFANSSVNGTPQAGKSLFAELGDLGGSDEEDSVAGTPSRRSTFASQTTTPASRPGTAKGTPAHPAEYPPPVSRMPMIDTGMMTEPWEPEPTTPTPKSSLPYLGAGFAGFAAAEAGNSVSDKHTSTTSTGSQIRVPMSDAASQWHEEQLSNQINSLQVASTTQEGSRPISASTYRDRSSQYDPAVMDEKLAKFPSPPTSRTHSRMASLSDQEAMAAPLSLSTILSEHVEPTEVESPVTPEEASPVTPKLAPLPAPLALSSIQSVDTEPIEPVSLRSPRRDGVMIPRDEPEETVAKEDPETPKPTFLGSVFGWNKNKAPQTPVIAEDETRQSPSDSPVEHTPESQRPFQEISHNTNQRALKKPRVEMNDESAQTTLTSDQIDAMLRNKRQDAILAEDSQKAPAFSPPRSATIPSALRIRKSQESIGSVSRARSKMADPDFAHDTIPMMRPSSAGSHRNGSISSAHPPLPTDHKQVIAAAAQRTGSSSGGQSSMGPPLMPASAYRNNPSFRPRTPSSQMAPLSPGSIKGGTTPRALHPSGHAGMHSPTGTGRSRQSSVSSFASELNNRFNMQAGILPQGIELGTDPRMINAITQTMIGEHLWKYTRKPGRGAMSENRHRRYFWVHPYTRTLYWSDRDPSQAGRAELKAKSVSIEAVRVVTDDNPMPPGLHRKSLVIMTPGRAVKFTATTGQRHETWFNALSYLLLRTGEEKVGDTSDVTNGALTREDVDEFNPSFGGARRGGPASLSSYNSRTTRNESPARTRSRLSLQPQLNPSTSTRPTMGTLSRLSNYWKPGNEGKTASFPNRRSRHSVSGATSIYEASEVHDSAEDLREMIEKQDRESDRLENVRACCDGKFFLPSIPYPHYLGANCKSGKHDVGHLHHGPHKGRTPSSNSATASGSTSSRLGPSTMNGRGSVIRRTG